MLKCISKCSYFAERVEALLKETITAILESASRVCTFKTNDAVKMELIKCLNEGFFVTLKEWFLNKFGKSFGAYEGEDYTEIKVHAIMLMKFLHKTRFLS